MMNKSIMEISITIEQLESLLNQQKRLVVERLVSCSAAYNSESTEGHQKPLPIDKSKFEYIGMNTRYPDDLVVLKKYIK